MLLFFVAPPALLAVEPPEPVMPSWWNNWTRQGAFSSPFIQEGESAAFGKLTKNGIILTARGGRLRVEYEKGILLMSDGRHLWQYDPSTRTAQSHDLEDVSVEWPLLRLLTDPAALNQVFHVSPLSDGKIKLAPKKSDRSDRSVRFDLPEILLEGKGGFLYRAAWKDGTGAMQTLTLTSPKIPRDPGNKPFSFELPKGAKWLRD